MVPGAQVPTFQIDADYVDYDGTSYGIQKQQFCIPCFKGSRPIAEFEVIPLSNLPDREQLAAKLSERGRRTMEMNKAHYMMHTGFVRHSNGMGMDAYGGHMRPGHGTERFVGPCFRLSQSTTDLEQVQGRILVDPDGHTKYCRQSVLQPLPDDLGSDAADGEHELSRRPLSIFR